MRNWIGLLGVLLWAGAAMAEVKGEQLEYSAGDTKMAGYLAEDSALKGQAPAILIVPDWMGVGKYAESKANELAKQGYVALAVDVYGIGVRPKDNEEASKMAGALKENRKTLRERMRAAYDALVARKEVDPAKVAVIGYCFGGTSALELARSGAPLVGTVTFHAGLSNPNPDDAKNIHGRVLVLHGAADPYVPPKEVAAFKEEMKKAKVPMKFIAYPGAVHSFTIPDAGNDPSKGAAYQAEADKKSWAEFQKFLKQVAPVAKK